MKSNKINKKKKNDEELRVIPGKNYAKLAVIFIVTVAVVLVAFVAYRTHREFINSIPVIRGSVSELAVDDLDTYFTEDDDFLLYVGVADDNNCRKLEESLIPMLKRKNITDIVYLNITDVENKASFFEEFNTKYSNNIKLNNYPAMVIVSDKKVVDLVEKSDRYLSIADVEKLFDEYEIVGELK